MLLDKKEYIKSFWGIQSSFLIKKILQINNEEFKILTTEIGIDIDKEIFIPDDYFLKYLKNNYKKKSLKSISKKFNCSESSVYKYAKQLNLTKKCVGWSTVEDNLLIENFNLVETKKLVQILKRNGYKRTDLAIIKRCKDLGLKSNITEHGDSLKSTEVMEILNFSKEKLNSLFYRGKMKCSLFKNKRLISIDDFKTFLKENQNIWHCDDTDIGYIKSIFSDFKLSKSSGSIEIEIESWLLEKIEKDKVVKKKEKFTWLYSEEQKIKKLLKEGCSTKQICKELNREYPSVYKKIKELQK